MPTAARAYTRRLTLLLVSFLPRFTPSSKGCSDLRRRVERGGHVPSRYSVEIRCSAATAAQLTGSPGAAPLPPTWEAEQAHWKALIFAPVRV